MNSFETEIRFLTPAFLGDAFQRGRWRTPPFKALLREWWRIAAAKQHDYDWESLREAEGLLFGHAFLEHNGRTWASRSRVSIRLAPWAKGGLKAWNEQPGPVHHPEVQFNNGQIDPFLYLGYGPLTYQNGVRLMRPPAIKAGETACLVIHSTDERIPAVARLIHAFGAMGSRCRNGWGSIVLACHEAMTADEIRGLAKEHARPLEDCLKVDWPHAFGIGLWRSEEEKEEPRVLVWKTKETFMRWEEAIQELARVKIAFRTALRSTLNRGNGGSLDERHILAYPVTNHRIDNLSQERLANQLRLKVVKDGNRFRGLAYHLPHKVPDTPNQKSLHDKFGAHDRSAVLTRQLAIWTKVHRVLDRAMIRL